MWWNEPRLREFPPAIPDNILDVVARAHAVVEVGGVAGHGPERGRNFEQLFYGICASRGVRLCEKAGSRSLAGQKSASGFGHEIDGATQSAGSITAWELKHLTEPLEKNELLIFNGKGLDYLYGSSPFFAQVPLLRFLLTGRTVRDEARYFAALWGVMIIEPGRLPLPLLYEAVARNFGSHLERADRDAVRHEVLWACRPLQAVLRELGAWVTGGATPPRCGPNAGRYARDVIAIQEQIGIDVTDRLAEDCPEWVDELARVTWYEVGGW